MNNLEHFYNRVINFNDAAGVKNSHKLDDKFWKSVQLQAKLAVEEAQETKDAADACDPVELLDGALDIMVIGFKLLDFLLAAGYDVSGAFDAVCDNNDSKVFGDYYRAVEAKASLEERDNKEYTIASSFVNGIEFFTVRREDGKIAKPVDFKSVDLLPFVPKHD